MLSMILHKCLNMIHHILHHYFGIQKSTIYLRNELNITIEILKKLTLEYNFETFL